MAAVRNVYCAHAVHDYILDIADATRASPGSCSAARRRGRRIAPRRAAARSTVIGRDFVSPDDVKRVAPATLAHRIVLTHGVDVHHKWVDAVGEIVGSVETPLP